MESVSNIVYLSREGAGYWVIVNEKINLRMTLVDVNMSPEKRDWHPHTLCYELLRH